MLVSPVFRGRPGQGSMAAPPTPLSEGDDIPGMSLATDSYRPSPPRREPGVALTFDDGPDPVWTPRVLEALDRARARATFFVVTPQARRFPGLVSAALAAGHEVELHCREHVRHTDLHREEAAADTREGLRDLRALGVRPRLWRPPWGALSPWTAGLAAGFGLELALWTEDTHDWRGDRAPEMLSSIGATLGPGSAVLMHDGLGPGARRSGCGETVGLVEGLVASIRARGCEPAPLGQITTAPPEPGEAVGA